MSDVTDPRVSATSPGRVVLRARFRRRNASLAPALLLAIGLAAPAAASTFGVRVIDDVGEPIAGAAVCVGLEGNYTQFGALFTDASGIATVDVPNVPLVVTVSKDRFSGVRLPEPARGFNLIKDVRLVEGTPGPRCRAGSSLAEAGIPEIRITDIDVESGAVSTVLTADVTGAPTHYRVAGDREFTDSSWQAFRDTIPVPGSLADADEVFLQLRRYAGSANGWLEARSDITTVSLPRN